MLPDVVKNEPMQIPAWLRGVLQHDRPVEAEAVQEARRALLDILSCVLLGSSSDNVFAGAGVDAATGVEAATGVGMATAFIKGGITSTGPRQAAFHNACLAQIHDANDGHTMAAARRGLGHPGRTVIPAALASAEGMEVSYGELLAAIVSGYGFGVALQATIHPENLEALGAVAAIGRLRRLPAELTMAAAGLALPLSPQSLPLGWSGRFDHNFLRTGLAVRTAFDAVEWVQMGLRGPDLADTAAAGILKLRADANSGQAAILGRYSKPYPSCRMTHAAIECALLLRQQAAIDIQSIDRIEADVVSGGGYVGDTTLHDDFKRRAFSLPVCVAIALHTGELTPATLGSAQPDSVARLARKVRVMENKAFDAIYPHSGRPSALRIYLRDGTCLQARVDIPKGEPQRPESDHELIQRLFAYAPSESANQHSMVTLANWILHASPERPVSELTHQFRQLFLGN